MKCDGIIYNVADGMVYISNQEFNDLIAGVHEAERQWNQAESEEERAKHGIRMDELLGRIYGSGEFTAAERHKAFQILD